MALRFPAGGALDPELLTPGPGLATHLIPLAVWGVGMAIFKPAVLALTVGLPPNAEQISLNWVLAVMLVVALACWTLLRIRGRVSAASGEGLVLTTYAMAAREWIEIGAFLGTAALEHGQAGPLLPVVLAGGRWVALGAFAFGLASAGAAVFYEVRRDGGRGRT